MLIQTLEFLTRLPTRQDGVYNRDKVYIAFARYRVDWLFSVLLMLGGNLHS